jgi:hypothetical protein
MLRSAFPAISLASPAEAQHGPALSLALDGLAQVEAACRLAFAARNGLGADADPPVVEAVAFDVEGGVARIGLFHFGALPAGRLRRFDPGETESGALGGVFVNGAQRCEGPEGCADAPSVASCADGVEMTQ